MICLPHYSCLHQEVINLVLLPSIGPTRSLAGQGKSSSFSQMNSTLGWEQREKETCSSCAERIEEAKNMVLAEILNSQPVK